MIISHGKGAMYLSRCFSCLIVLIMSDMNLSGMYKFYYYSIIIQQCIEKTISDLDYQRLFPDILSLASIWNESDDESYEEESLSNYCTLYSKEISIFHIKIVE